MIYRWLYKLWIYFWVTVGTLLGVAALLTIFAGAFIQLPQAKEYFRSEMVSAFNNQFEGELDIREIRGFLPFSVEVIQGSISAPDDSTTPLISFDHANITVDWWELLQQNLSISSLEIVEPTIFLKKSGDELNVASTFRQRAGTRNPEQPDSETPQIINQINIFAPYLSFIDGEITMDQSIELPDQLNLPETISLSDVNTTLFLEITESQLFVDIQSISANLPGTEYGYMQGSGQFYSDNEFFELNGFQLQTDVGGLNFSMEATPINLYGRNVVEQFREAEYTVDVSNSSFSSTLIQRFFPEYPDSDQNLLIEMEAEGTFSEFFVDRFQASIGETSLIFSAVSNNLLSDNISYDVQLENLVLHPTEMEVLSALYLDSLDLTPYDISTVRGEFTGDFNVLNSNVTLRTASGDLSVDSYFEFNELLEYELLAEIDSLDVSPIFRDSTNSTILNGRFAAQGQGLSTNAEAQASFDFGSSTLFGYDFDQLIADFDYASNKVDYNLFARDNNSSLRSSGSYSEGGNQKQFTTNGSVENLNVTPYTDFIESDSTNFNGTFSANFQGNNLEDLLGRFSVEMSQSTIDSDTLRSHQLYADILSQEDDSRTLRFTSSFLDGEISGTLSPSTLDQLVIHWAGYFEQQINQDLLFVDEIDFIQEQSTIGENDNPDAELSVSVFLKDLDLLRKYFPDMPVVNSGARISGNLRADKNRLVLSGNIFDQLFRYENIEARNLNSSLSANFRYGSTLIDYNSIDFQLNSSEFSYNDMNFNESFFNYSMRNDSLEVSQSLNRDDNISLNSTLFGVITPGQIDILVDQFNIGSDNYNWSTDGKPSITYDSDKALTLEHVLLTSDNDLIEINGTFSSNIEDSVEYTVENFDISRISDLIGGRITFSGLMNGEFVTQSLGEIPSIQGDIQVENGQIDDRIIGDVTLNSIFNAEENRFDTNIRVYTDPEKYPDYYESNNNIGQDLSFTGYFKLPEDVAEDEDLFYFDADLREIDMWIVTFIVPLIVEDMEGRSSGRGFIRGSQNDYDFDATFDITDVYGVPAFLSTGFNLEGELDFNRSDGLIFKDIELSDQEGGTGLLSGEVDLDDFSGETFIDLTLDMNDLHVLNNSYDPDIPFYANLYGTGQVQITGTNFSPFLRTTNPVQISSDSQISIPLEEETEFEQDRRFIQFVDSFDLSQLTREEEDENSNGRNNQSEEELTFIERFTMDLQFAANDPINVQLIFDRVTNEVLNAEGTGQVRVLLEDQDVSMFGRFNIEGGTYQFVSGDIFTRRFNIEEGGSISWQGDLVDASMNVNAAYRARPSIASLLSTSSTSAPISESGQRIPIELVLQIGGTINAVENDFFFRVPTGIEGTLDPTISTQINNLNQNEEEKLIQATSILLSGNFLPSSEAQGLGLGEGITGTAAVVNPLLTSQVINPLLSNQINSLLRSDITFDIDLNLTAFNEVDLGVALRLFDDRVVLRREGQITGEQSDIGDIGATYRINRTFSLTAFHRQDPTLSYTSGVEARQTQEMNGMGLEAQVQFNTWRRFREQISNAIKSIFGIKPDDEEDEEDENPVAIN